jgi:FtsP/CotA-like multicopper oxidase with cupredoxin domain
VIPNAVFTYEFVCSEPGTYMYHCHVLTPLHLAMGMYGLVIVGGEAPELLYDNTTKYTKEFSFLFSEMNLNWNTNPLSPGPFALYEADYLMVNGMSDQETDFTDNAVVATEDDTLAFRMANIGYGSVRAIFPPELEVFAVASDGRRITPIQTNELEIFPGERFDFLARPLQDFEGVISVDHIDLRNNNLLGSNDIPVTVTSTVGLTKETILTARIYPNPFSESVHVEATEYPATIDVLDNTGKLLSSVTVHSPSEVDLQNLAKGMYNIRIGTEVMKIIKH